MHAFADRPEKQPRHWRIAMSCLVAVLFANALGYVAVVANPLIAYDNWTFVDTFLRIAVERGAGLGDFLVKRAGVDHAQPLHKLLMLLNYRWFGLDFRLEAYVGMAFGMAGMLVLWRLVARDYAAQVLPSTYALLAAIAAVYFSIDSLNIYLYSMVTLWYANYLCFFLLAWACWGALDAGRQRPLAAIALVTALVADDTAILSAVALAGALALHAPHARRTGTLKNLLVAIGIILATLVVARLVYATFGEIRGTTKPEFNVPILDRLVALAGQWPDAWRMVSRPLASGLIAPASAQRLFGAAGEPIHGAIAVLVLLGHAWFWRQAWRLPARSTRFMAVALMLLFYVHVAGLLLGRVFVRGVGFLDQERYVSFYHLGLIAWLLMAIAWRQEYRAAGSARRDWTVVVSVAILALQVPLSLAAWRQSAALDGHYRQMAADMAAAARAPGRAPSGCLHGVDVCGFPRAQRERVLGFLQRSEVNLFSPRFQRRHPQLAAAAGLPAPAPAAMGAARRVPAE